MVKAVTVGVVGGGLGGLTAALALARGGATVTVLEAARELGEIGAGIQMTPNVSRFLVRTGVDKLVGDNLVQVDELRTWSHKKDELVGRVFAKDIVKDCGFPWWVVRRDHLHRGLVEGCERAGVKLRTGFRACKLQHDADGASITSQSGETCHFDLLVGADGVNGYMRKAVFPEIKLKAASKHAAYRTVVSYKEVFEKVPEARWRIANTMDTWVGPRGYVLLYPLTGCKELNIVTSWVQDREVTTLEEVDLRDFRQHYADWDPFVNKILDLVKETKRWPLLTAPRQKSWSTSDKRVVLMGDCIHAMPNHMAQGAATAMEDGIFLGRVIAEMLRDTIDLKTAIHLYEKKRIPRAFHKMNSAYIKGELASLSDEKLGKLRNDQMAPEIQSWNENPRDGRGLPPAYRTWQLMASPASVPSILNYDAESDADWAVDEWLIENGKVDGQTEICDLLRQKWFSPLHDNGIKVNSSHGRKDVKL